MIYEIYLDGRLLYYPGDSVYTLCDAKLELQLNEAGSLEFQIPVTNPLYSSIRVRASMVQVLKDGKEIFCGEVREAEEVMEGLKNVYAVGELAFLYDSIQPQGRFQNVSPEEFFINLLEVHNSQVEERKQFTAGIVTVKDSNDSIYRYTNREDTLSDIRNKLCDSLDGYLRIRKDADTRYLDLVTLEDYGKRSSQPIQFGDNLLDYTENVSGEDIATVVIPLGSMLDESPVEGLDAYTDITSVNDGKDYIELSEAIERFGRIAKVQTWDDVTVPANLKKKGEAWLRSKQFETAIININAVDLSMLQPGIESYEVGDLVQFLTNWGSESWVPLQKKILDLLAPENDQITLGYTSQGKYTDQVNKIADRYNQEYANIQGVVNTSQAALQTAQTAAQTATEANTAVSAVGQTVAQIPTEYVKSADFKAYKQQQEAVQAGFVKTEDIPAVPGNLSELENDTGYITAADVPITAEQYQDILDRLSVLESNSSESEETT